MKNITLQHYSSNSGNKPSASNLTYGEIAIGYKADNEAIYIKNDNDDIVEFHPTRGGGSIVETTYSELKSLRDEEKLQPSTWYRITDFVTTVANDNEARSANHAFDVLVFASDINVLQEEAFAMLHEGDEYFKDSKLEAWKIWYCLDNDTYRFQWADDTNGKGVIYRMIDEWNNDCPYDFKNIQFKRYKVKSALQNALSDFVAELYDSDYSMYFGMQSKAKAFEIDSSDFKWKYTFNDSEEIDASIGDAKLTYNGAYDNIIKPNRMRGTDILALNNIVFLDYSESPYNQFEVYGNIFEFNCYNMTLGRTCIINTFGTNCQDNSFGENCGHNLFGDGCKCNTFGSYCHYNTFGADCGNNTFGGSCNSNTFENYCGSNTFTNCSGNTFDIHCFGNTFGDSCNSNTFGNYCQRNTFGDYCEENTFGNKCYNNTFGNECQNNLFGDVCQQNTFGNECCSNTFWSVCEQNKCGEEFIYNSFGNRCCNNTFGDYCYSNTFGNYCDSNTFGGNFSSNTLGERVQYVQVLSNPIKYTQILNGTRGSSDTKKLDINFTPWATYSQFAGFDSEGNLQIWVEADNKKYYVVTYDKLVELRNNKKLVPSAYYRITDFVTTVAKNTDIRSANHPFDVLVFASDVNVLQEEAFARLHEGDEYFKDSKLEVWKIWYCLDNDTTRFTWADATNGKGVIYRMIDEWNNDCPYDFKNVQFRRCMATTTKVWSLNNTYVGIPSIYQQDLTRNEEDFIWCYTFSKRPYDSDTETLGWENVTDLSLEGNFCHGNIILSNYKSLNNIVFLDGYLNEDDSLQYGTIGNEFGTSCYNNTFLGGNTSNIFGESCSRNIFSHECHGNIFGDTCFANIFAELCCRNTFGTWCGFNTLKSDCDSNIFETGCVSNTFGYDCRQNILGSGSEQNIFGNECCNNTFGADCSLNIFGDHCEGNAFGNRCHYNTVGNHYYYSTFGNDCWSNTFNGVSSYNTLGEGVRYVDVITTEVRYAQILNGTKGDPENKLIINFLPKTNYSQFAGIDSEGNLQVWVEADNNKKYYVVTYNQLVALRNVKKLVPSTYYRITDFVTTVANDSEAQSANHPFDIFIMATDVDKLQEECIAMHHEGDEYFKDCKLESWKIWYCLDNDTSRFQWADTTRGKGVIYRMIDEWNNDCPYDFKNVQFKRYKVTSTSVPSLNDTYVGISSVNITGLTKNNNDFIWCYTFSERPYDLDEDIFEWENLTDLSLNGFFCYNNTILPNYLTFHTHLSLNNIVFLDGYEDEEIGSYGTIGNQFNVDCYNNTFLGQNHFNTFGENCYDNVFGNGCNYNTFGNYCGSNIFGNDCKYNTFGDNCWYNIFVSNCDRNTFGDSCLDNTFRGECNENTVGDTCTSNRLHFNCANNAFGNHCNANTFGGNCYNNVFGDNCSSNYLGGEYCSNTFGVSCKDNRFEDGCEYNLFANGCNNNTFGCGCIGNTFGNNCEYIEVEDNVIHNTFGNNCSRTKLGAHSEGNTFGNKCGGNYFGDVFSNNTLGESVRNVQIDATNVQYTQILNGTQGSNDTNKLTINFTPNVNYSQKAGFDSTNTLRIWVEGNLADGKITAGTY